MGAAKTAILLAVYGSANPQSQRAVRNFDLACRRRFSDYPVRWAFTSPILRERMAGMRKKSDSALKALLKLGHEKFGCALVQPLQSIPGQEYHEVLDAARKASESSGLLCEVGRPLMSRKEDAQKTADALLQHLPPERRQNEDIVFVGHGARCAGFHLYRELAASLARKDPRFHLGVMSGELSLEKILPRLASETVWLIPLLSVVGRHAQNDIAGEEPQSWRSRIEAAGHLCRPVLKGISEYPSVAAIWLDNLAEAAAALALRI